MNFLDKFSPNGKKEEFKRDASEEQQSEEQENLVLSEIIEEEEKIYFKISQKISIEKVKKIFNEIVGNLYIEPIIRDNFSIEADADEGIFRITIYTKDFSHIENLKQWAKNILKKIKRKLE